MMRFYVRNQIHIHIARQSGRKLTGALDGCFLCTELFCLGERNLKSSCAKRKANIRSCVRNHGKATLYHFCMFEIKLYGVNKV